jgi:hypothetical protein
MGYYITVLNKKIASLDSYKSLYETANKENKQWKDKSGLWHNKTETAVVTKDNLENIKELQDIASEINGLKKNLKNLESYINVNSSTTIESTIKIKDTTIYNIKDSSVTKLKHFTYKDKWQRDSVAIIGDSARFFHESNDSLAIVGFWERKWFLGKKTYFTEIKSYNPNTKINYQRSIKVNKRKKGLFGF